MDGSPVDDILLAKERPYHINVVYRSDASLVSSAGLFLHAAMVRGGAAIVMATTPHLEALNGELTVQGLDLAALKQQGRYIPLDAETVLARFTRNGELHEAQTRFFALDLLLQAGAASRPVSMYGEVVGLFAQRHDLSGAGRLEDLWADILREAPHAVLCGYPGSAFEGPAGRRELRALCQRHAHTIGRAA